ncbi:ankyrin repeat and SOCS box protein 11 isoform 2-T2 [Odontesthes bonariensis]
MTTGWTGLLSTKRHSREDSCNSGLFSLRASTWTHSPSTESLLYTRPVSAVISHVPNFCWTAVQMSRSADCVRLLLQHGASVHTIHPLASPIHEAAKNGHRECLELLLLSSGAPIDMELPEVGTALYSACQAQAAACVEVLLHSGADVHAGRGLESPLHAAVRGGGSNVVELLLDFGADRWCRNAEGRTPLDLSLPNSAVRVTLQKRGSCSLFQLCRLCIRRSLGRSRLHKASSLNLPNSITDYLLHR